MVARSDDSEGPCDLVTVPARQGLEAVDILRRRNTPLSPEPGASRRPAGDGAATDATVPVGPVLHDGDCDTLGFLVPPGTAEQWDLPGSACTETFGRGARLAPDAAPPVDGTGWLVPPEDAETVTDPAALRDALGEAARVIEAADRCR
ncbi:hypothetical protein [Streptomyces sp. TP-A0874]|uniref:hypothetical protein n=1 Tax=Streptomyces sp. TP-A0874 TaxID=549819 RepID=UPI00147BDCC1|nr:hypothetical protein [Streptomyces sp. TP-A0874]